MKRSTIILSMSSILIFATTIACVRTPPPTPGLSDANVAATVNAAVAATNTAEADMKATISAAVAATNAAATQPTPTATLVVVATDAPGTEQPIPAPSPAPPATPAADTSTMSEEELAIAIDAAVAAAVVAADEVAAATDNAATDGTITYEETASVEVTLANADEAIALAEALIVSYYDMYGTYASEALDILNEIEDELDVIADNAEDIAEILEQGSETATVARERIQAAAAAAREQAAQIQTQAQAWQEALHREREHRTAQALAAQPNQIATDRQGAIRSAFTYVETVRSGLADGAISPGELSEIAQAGANASASIRTHGGSGLQNMADSIDGLTRQIARGEWPQAKGNLDVLESSLPSQR